MRARLALVVSETCCLLREVDLSNKPAQLIAASPKGTVPVLVLPGDHVLDESLDIMRWALRTRDPDGWLQADPVAAQVLIRTNDEGFKTHLDRYKYADVDETKIEHRSAGLEILRSLDERLSSQANLCSDDMSIADAAVLPFVRQYAQVDRVWFDSAPVPHLRRWLDGHLSSALWERIAVRVKPWAEGDPPIFFSGRSRAGASVDES
jgi:glutathione S-transferase